MDAREFNYTFLQITLEKRSYKNKDIILMGDFNIDVLKYDTNNDSAAFLDMMYENFLLPYISSPTRVTPRSETLIDNIFSNIIDDEIISGNIATTISDHYAQFTLFKNKIKSQKDKKIAKFARNYKTLDKEIFDSDLKNMNWKEILKIEEMLTIPLKLSTKKSMRFLINMHLSKNYQSKMKNSQKNLGSLLEYLIQLKIKIGSIERS